MVDNNGGGKRKPHPDDIRVGMNVRRLREKRGMSQVALSEHLDLTFQQVQKYEAGTNRIGASRLLQIARALEVEISDIFDVEETWDVRGFRSFPARVASIARKLEKLNTKQLASVSVIVDAILAAYPATRCPHTLEMPLEDVR